MLKFLKDYNLEWTPYDRLVKFSNDPEVLNLLGYPPIPEKYEPDIKLEGWEKDVFDKTVFMMASGQFNTRFILLTSAHYSPEEISSMLGLDINIIPAMQRLYWNVKVETQKIIKFLNYMNLTQPTRTKMIIRALGGVDVKTMLIEQGVIDTSDQQELLKQIVVDALRKILQLHSPRESVHYERYANVLLNAAKMLVDDKDAIQQLQNQIINVGILATKDEKFEVAELPDETVQTTETPKLDPKNNPLTLPPVKQTNIFKKSILEDVNLDLDEGIGF